jgi:hypothetical protein
MRYLLFISLVFCLFSCSSHKDIGKKTVTATSFWTAEILDTAARNDFQVIFSSSKANITGIFIAKKINGEWRGSIVNEFGIKTLDFISTSKKTKVINVISFLDKWYIKNIIASDIQFVMEIDNPDYMSGVKANRNYVQDTLTIFYKKIKELQRLPDGTIIYKNHKYKHIYSLKKINETER